MLLAALVLKTDSHYFVDNFLCFVSLALSLSLDGENIINVKQILEMHNTNLNKVHVGFQHQQSGGVHEQSMRMYMYVSHPITDIKVLEKSC